MFDGRQMTRVSMMSEHILMLSVDLVPVHCSVVKSILLSLLLLYGFIDDFRKMLRLDRFWAKTV